MLSERTGRVAELTKKGWRSHPLHQKRSLILGAPAPRNKPSRTGLPTSSRCSISIANVYISPESSTHTRDLPKLVASLPSAQGLICRDFNEHHPVWDDVARSDERVTALF